MVEKEEIREAILKYLSERPNAQDTLEGITRWWVTRSISDINIENVKVVIERLCKEGILVQKKIVGTNALYTLKKDQASRSDNIDYKHDEGFSLTELMVVLVIIGVLVLLALPKLMPIVTKAKTTEAKLMLKQVYTLEQSYRFEHDRFSANLTEISFEQEKLVSEGGQARYRIDIKSANENAFVAQATSVVDFNGDGTYNVWEVDHTGIVKEKVPD